MALSCAHSAVSACIEKSGDAMSVCLCDTKLQQPHMPQASPPLPCAAGEHPHRHGCHHSCISYGRHWPQHPERRHHHPALLQRLCPHRAEHRWKRHHRRHHCEPGDELRCLLDASWRLLTGQLHASWRSPSMDTQVLLACPLLPHSLPSRLLTRSPSASPAHRPPESVPSPARRPLLQPAARAAKC